MKIAVYAICKDEEKHVRRWMDSARDADYICLLDTGSTDETLRIAHQWDLANTGPLVIRDRAEFEPWSTLDEYDAIAQHGWPWRFDAARNRSMELIPEDTDVCICLDLDEILCPGWREAIERVWNDLDTTGRYEYVWNFRPDGSDGVKYLGEKIHRYGGCRWVGAVHEVLRYDGPRVDVQIPGLRIEHHADDGKSRSNYLPMLELAVREDPDNDRNMHYLGREYFFRGQYEKAIETLRRHLELPTATWDEERAASMRYIGLSFERLDDMVQADAWLLNAHIQAPKQREPLVERAKLALSEQRWGSAVTLCEEALGLTERPMTYMCDPYAWNEGPWDLMAVALWYVGKRESARECARKAAELNPGDERLVRNLQAMGGLNRRVEQETAGGTGEARLHLRRLRERTMDREGLRRVRLPQDRGAAQEAPASGAAAERSGRTVRGTDEEVPARRRMEETTC